MSDRDKKYNQLLTSRNIWIFTLIGLIIVLFTWILLALDQNLEFSLSQWYFSVKTHPALIIFSGLPFYIYILLVLARKQFEKEISNYIKEKSSTQEILDQNTEFARLLSEGDDPPVSQLMLRSDLGQSLKLVQLNAKSNRRKERDITWINDGKDMISRILRVNDKIDELAFQILKGLSKYISAIQAAMYLYDADKKELKNISVLAYNRQKYLDQVFKLGQGLVGQCAYEMDYIYRTEIPDDYVSITSGILGDQKPKSILLIPLITNGQLQGVLEFAFFEHRIPKLTIQFLLELGEIIARTFYNLRVNEQTKFLLEESRKMTVELQDNEQVLNENAEEMKTTQEELQKANIQLEAKIDEASNAQDRLLRLLENASEIISIYDQNFKLKYISLSVNHILGYSADEMIAGKDFERIDQIGSNEIRKAFDKLLIYTDQVIEIEYIFMKKDGKRLYLRSTIRNRLSDPSINGFIFNTRDITQSRRVEKEQRLKTRMQSLSENSLDMILRISKNGMIHYANPVVEDYSGLSPAAILNKPLDDVAFPERLSEIILSSLHQVKEKPLKINRKESIPMHLGEKSSNRIINFDVIPEFDEGELETILFVGHDITEAKRIEAEIKVTNKKIQDSINYAERIQTSILPEIEQIQKAFPKSFVYYKPRDMISGDFPWMYETDDAWFISAIDCTGHGVPGALLSFIGFFLLNNITALHPSFSAGQICDMLNSEVRRTLKQDQKNPDARDGMDLALCKVYKNENKIEFAGAHRPLYILREGELTVFKGDRRAIGGLRHPKRAEKDFETHEYSYRKGDKIFFFSDGLTDQMGGPDGNKYGPARVRDILLENPGFTIRQFYKYFEYDFSSWLGKERQLDDVLLIGIEF